MLQRINELSVQAANQTNTTTQVGYLNSEVKQLQSEINRIGSETKFNGKNVFGSSASAETQAARRTIVSKRAIVFFILSALPFVLSVSSVGRW